MKKTSDYAGVSYAPARSGAKGSINENVKSPWCAHIMFGGKRIVCKRFATERDAAIACDKAVLRAGLDRPLNILKPKL